MDQRFLQRQAGLDPVLLALDILVDFLKIAGSFVRDVLTDSVDRATAEAVCHIGWAIGATLIAEWGKSETLLA